MQNYRHQPHHKIAQKRERQRMAIEWAIPINSSSKIQQEEYLLRVNARLILLFAQYR